MEVVEGAAFGVREVVVIGMEDCPGVAARIFRCSAAVLFRCTSLQCFCGFSPFCFFIESLSHAVSVLVGSPTPTRTIIPYLKLLVPSMYLAAESTSGPRTLPNPVLIPISMLSIYISANLR